MVRKASHIRRVESDAQPEGVPAGQFVTEKFPVLTLGSVPEIELTTWRFRVFGLVREEVIFDWEDFVSIQPVTVEAPFHCVTQWSRMANTWEGVSFAEVMKRVRPAPEARYVMVHCYGGHSTNVALDVLNDDDVLFAYRHDDAPLELEHGGPLRLIVPKRYGYKSAKWVSGIELMAEDGPGTWEALGYHMNADPLKEERFWSELS